MAAALTLGRAAV